MIKLYAQNSALNLAGPFETMTDVPVKRNRTLPKQGIPSDQLVTLMRGFHKQDKSRWEAGQHSGTVYHGSTTQLALPHRSPSHAHAHPPHTHHTLARRRARATYAPASSGEPEHLKVQDEAFALFSVSNPLHTDVWPSVNKFESEIIAMTASLVNGGDEGVCGTVTSGGTESVIMATKTHRQWAELEKGITEPEIICADSAHAAIDKACDMLRIKLIKIPVDPVTFQADPAKFEAAMSPNTIMLYSSAPNYPQGVIDPIEALSNLAQSKGVGLHVDCCLGGFYLPFLRRLPAHAATVPAFDFALPGVTSMSADTHKYGYATKGTSVVLYRSAELRQHQFFVYPRWSGGLYATPSTAGSRPGALSAACWASLMKLGDEGFLRCTAQIAATVEKFKAAIAATDGLRMLGQPVGMVVAFVSDDFNVYRLADAMASDGGYGLSQCQHPPCVHICFTMRHVHHIDAIIAAVRKCTAALLAAPHDEAEEGKGAAIYGMAASMPKEGVDAMMSSYLAGVTDNGWEEGAPPPGSSKL